MIPTSWRRQKKGAHGLAMAIFWLKLRFFFRSVVKLCLNVFRNDSGIPFFDVEKFFRNFDWPFTPPGWLRSASNFGKTRFRWSPTFDFSTPKTFLRPKFLSDKIFRQHSENVFQQSACFGGAVLVWTSLADAPRKFIARHIGFNPLRPLAEG